MKVNIPRRCRHYDPPKVWNYYPPPERNRLQDRHFQQLCARNVVKFSQVYAVYCLYHSSCKSPFAHRTADYNGHEPFTKKHVTGCSQSVGSEIYTTHVIPSRLARRCVLKRHARLCLATFGLLSVFVTKCKAEGILHDEAFPEKSRNSISVLCTT